MWRASGKRTRSRAAAASVGRVPPHDQRAASAYIFGAVCPAEGKGAGLGLPSCNSEAMALHLKEISIAVAPGAHAILLLDEAGWHISTKLLRDVDEVQFAESARSLGS